MSTSVIGAGAGSNFYTEEIDLNDSTHFKVSDSDATEYTESGGTYVLKKTFTLSVPSWMQNYGTRATLICEYQSMADGTATADIQTTVDDGDALNETEANKTAYQDHQHEHTDITSFSSSIAVKFYERISSGSGNAYLKNLVVTLQVGTKSTSLVKIFSLTDNKSTLVTLISYKFQVFSGATNTATLEFRPDNLEAIFIKSGTDINESQGDADRVIMTPINDEICFYGSTSLATNPMVLEELKMIRVYFT